MIGIWTIVTRSSFFKRILSNVIPPGSKQCFHKWNCCDAIFEYKRTGGNSPREREVIVREGLRVWRYWRRIRTLEILAIYFSRVSVSNFLAASKVSVQFYKVGIFIQRPNNWRSRQDFELEVKFKPEAAPIFVKARTVPFSIQEDLNQALDAGIRKGIWFTTHFNEYGTPIVPIRKSPRPGEKKADFRICGDYSWP